MTETALLASWRDTPTRSAVLSFLEASSALPPERRVAVFDNDGTLWCEKPNYVQLDFLVAELVSALESDPDLGTRIEYRAVLDGDHAALATLGLDRIVSALLELCGGITPEAFDQRVETFFATATHPGRGVPYTNMRYQPMLELLDALITNEFSVFIVSGGGTDFTRVISRQFYGVDPERLVGSRVAYDFVRVEGRPRLLRRHSLDGDPNEGEEKVHNIQRVLGRRPILAAGNSAGDAEMLEYATAGDGPSLALLVDHDDAEREYAYESVSATIAGAPPILDTAARLGWTVVSMRDDWSTVFAGA